jgi:hypothetical protein
MGLLAQITDLTLQDVTNIATIMGSLSLVVSVWLLFRELRDTNKLTRAANTQSLVDLSSPFYLGLIQDRQMAEIYLRGARALEEMDEVDRYRYKSLIVWWLVFHENIYYQWRNGLLDHHSYKPWANDLKSFIALQKIEPLWEEMKHLFQDEFTSHIGEILEAMHGPARRAGGVNPPIPFSGGLTPSGEGIRGLTPPARQL